MPDCYERFELNSDQRVPAARILAEGEGSVRFKPLDDEHVLLIDGEHEWMLRPNGEAVHGPSPYAIGNPD